MFNFQDLVQAFDWSMLWIFITDYYCRLFWSNKNLFLIICGYCTIFCGYIAVRTQFGLAQNSAEQTYSKRKNFFASHVVKHGGSQFKRKAAKAAREGLRKQNQYRKRNIEVLHPKAVKDLARTPRGVQLRVQWLIFGDLLVLMGLRWSWEGFLQRKPWKCAWISNFNQSSGQSSEGKWTKYRSEGVQRNARGCSTIDDEKCRAFCNNGL